MNSAVSGSQCSTRIRTLRHRELWQRLSDSGLPNLWLPKRENLYQVESLPTLGTGKLDLRAVKSKAQELAFGNVQTQSA